MLIMATPSCGFYGNLLKDTTPGFRPTTLWLRVLCPNHSAMTLTIGLLTLPHVDIIMSWHRLFDITNPAIFLQFFIKIKSDHLVIISYF
jgi:hypothetical protein